MLNGLSVDVEDAFHASAFEHKMDPSQWQNCEQRAPAHVDRLLELFSRFEVKGTFFVLGWMAEHHPEMVQRICQAGHEVACHGYNHRLVYRQTRTTFREDVKRAKEVLEQLIGQAVFGYRAPSYSITPRSVWAVDILTELGFSYDSSIFPIQHDRYGFPNAPRAPYRLVTNSGADLIELPPSSIRVGRTNIPVAGGGYFRLLPLMVTQLAISRLNSVEAMPAFVYVHPWEIDENQPRLTRNPLRWWRHSVNIKRVEARLASLLQQFEFAPMREVMRQQASFSTFALDHAAAQVSG